MNEKTYIDQEVQQTSTLNDELKPNQSKWLPFYCQRTME